MRRIIVLAALLGLFVRPVAARADYLQTNLVSDGAVPAVQPTDPDLKNPWGISASSNSPFWVSDQGTGVSTLYNTSGVKQGLRVTIPGGSPTGQLFNSFSDIQVGGSQAFFLFASLKGTISGWNGSTTATTLVTTAGAAYTGIAEATNGSDHLIYAANARGSDANSSTGIDVFNKNFNPVTLKGTFQSPDATAGFTPYNIANVGGLLYVTYSKRGSPGGFVDAFHTDGTFAFSLNGTGWLNSPWGVVMAPEHFGTLGGDLLVGNFGDGTISAFDPKSHDFVGQLMLNGGQAFSEPGLWGLIFGNGHSGGKTGTLYFTAGINNEKDGLFGSLSPTPEPNAALLLGVGGLVVGAYRARGHFRRILGRRGRPG
jgi:uncharacterized protein (TIGR03118 family)